MIGHRAKIRQHLRSARAAALTPEERIAEMRAAEARCDERLTASAEAPQSGEADIGSAVVTPAALGQPARPASADAPAH